jgi:type IV secretory pathway TrbF-like protein
MSLPLNLAKAMHEPTRHFVELYGDSITTNRHLKVANLAQAVVSLCLIAMNIWTYQMVLTVKPVVVRINEIGRAEAINYGNLTYHPQDAEIRYFLTQFVQQHYARVRTTLQDDYARSLYFLDGRVADTVIESNKKTKELETFLVNGSEEVRVVVKNVSIEDLRSAPYKATVDFERQYSSLASPGNVRREKSEAHFIFVLKDRVSNEMIPVNPLGLTITYFREDQAFQQ